MYLSDLKISVDGMSQHLINYITDIFRGAGIELFRIGDFLFSDTLEYDAEPILSQILVTLKDMNILINGTMKLTGDYDGTYFFQKSERPEHVSEEQIILLNTKSDAKTRYKNLVRDYLSCKSDDESMIQKTAMREAEYWLKTYINVDPKPLYNEVYSKFACA